MGTPSPAKAAVLSAVLAAALCGGCAARRSGEVVRTITFTVEGRPYPRALWSPMSNRVLRRVMAQQESSWQSLLFPGALEPAWLDRGRLRRDEQRLEVWFAEHGYFDAQVLDWEITRRGAGERRIRPVTVRGIIDPGPASLVRAVAVRGLDGVRPGVARGVRGAISVAQDKPFSSDDYTATLAEMRRVLLAGGYAYATVTGAVDAYPDEHAVDVALVVTPGPRSRFGPVVITGAEDMPSDIIADTVTFDEGDAYTPRDLAETRAAFYALRTFSAVNVTPNLDHPESGLVPVTIALKPSAWRRIKLGPAIALETGKASAYATAEWENHNLLHRLWHTDQTIRAGVAGVVAQDTTTESFDASQLTVAPVLDLKSALGVPHVLGPRWSLDVDGRLQVGIEQGYRFASPELAPGLTWHPTEHLDLALGYRIRYFDYFAFTIEVKDIRDSPLGLDLTDPYLLSMLEQRLTWDRRDDPLAPTRGWFGSLAVAEAGGPVLGNFTFLRAQAEARGYLSAPKLGRWKPRLVLAARLGAGIIVPYGAGPKASVPFAERLYLGGGTTVRGWGANRLGPSTTVTNKSTGADEIVPAGGLFDALGNLELRKGVVGGLSVAVFTDVGRVWATLAEARLDGIQTSVGGGLRYATAIGPVRADVGVRLGDDPTFAQQPRWALHFGLSEAF